MYNRRNLKHGYARKRKTRIYKIRAGIRGRCLRVSCSGYQNYGGRGIKCERSSFEEFYRDMGEKYHIHVQEFGEQQTTIDRIDVDGNYCKENCRRLTAKEQASNRRNNKMYDGKTLSERSRKSGLSYNILYQRMHLYNISIYDAIKPKLEFKEFIDLQKIKPNTKSDLTIL